MCIPHAKPVTATMFTGWTYQVWSFLHVDVSTHPHYCTNSTNTDWQIVLGSNCWRPTSTWISHSSLQPHTSENS